MMEVLKIATAGSVDDGKSTLIGRILYDTQSLTSDKLEAIRDKSKAKGFDYLDFSLATDGLVAEREQGITIDVAHIYFSTAKKNYILADSPGHVEYTRNMVTGASTSQASIILVDARKGVVEQTSRHFFINNMLRIKELVVAVNKMDMVGFSKAVFDEIRSDFEELIQKNDFKEQHITFIPISALHGDNVVNKSSNTSWYEGKSLLEYFETLQTLDLFNASESRFPVQSVIRPKKENYHDFRGYAGKLYGGDLSVGDAVTVLPSERTSKIKEILFFDQKYQTAARGSSCAITLEDALQLSRGDVIVKSNALPVVTKQISARVCWMHKKPLQLQQNYEIQSGPNRVLAKVKDISVSLGTNFLGETQSTQELQQELGQELQLNAIGRVQLQLRKPIAIDSFSKNKVLGSFIFIDPQTNTTAGVGCIILENDLEHV